MKQRNRLLALLMALCLAVSVLVVPASAAGENLNDLETAWKTAEREYTEAQSKVTEMETSINNAPKPPTQEELEAAQRKIDEAKRDNLPADQISQLESEKADLESKKADADRLQKQLEGLRGEAQSKKDAMDAAEKLYKDAKAAADEAAKQEEEDKKNEEANQKAKLTPGSGDLTFSVNSVDLGTLAKDSTSGRSKSFTITNNSSLYVMYLSCANPSGYTVSGVPSSLAPGSSATVTVYYVFSPAFRGRKRNYLQ